MFLIRVAFRLRTSRRPTSSEVRARTIYLNQIGYFSMKSSESLAVRMERIPPYVEIFTGVRAEPEELARFHARHSFDANNEQAAMRFDPRKSRPRNKR